MGFAEASFIFINEIKFVFSMHHIFFQNRKNNSINNIQTNDQPTQHEHMSQDKDDRNEGHIIINCSIIELVGNEMVDKVQFGLRHREVFVIFTISIVYIYINYAVACARLPTEYYVLLSDQ